MNIIDVYIYIYMGEEDVVFFPLFLFCLCRKIFYIRCELLPLIFFSSSYVVVVFSRDNILLYIYI